MSKLIIDEKGFEMLTVYQALEMMPDGLEEGVHLSAITNVTREDLMRKIEKLCPGIEKD